MLHRIAARDLVPVACRYATATRSITSVASAFARANQTQSVTKTWTFQPLSSVVRSHRLYSVLSQSPAKVFKYEDMKKLVEEADPSTVLIDVREPVEFQEGHIPGARNVPFKSSPGAFDLSEEEFEDAFGFPKPSTDSNLVFYCLGGVRSTAAEELAQSFGYTKRGNYIGSWEDWVANENAKK